MPKDQVRRPRAAVIFYSAFADPSMTVPAIVAGADAIVHKGGQPRELFDAIRETARGDKALPPVSEPLLKPPARRLAGRRRPRSHATMRLERAELDRRIAGMLSRLKVPVPAARGPSDGGLSRCPSG